jgi:hypothetical protein
VKRVGPALWHAAGLKARGYHLRDDYNCEVWFNNAWHLLNVYMRMYYPDRVRTRLVLAEVKRELFLAE